jgi:hypothetical protein
MTSGARIALNNVKQQARSARKDARRIELPAPGADN